MFEWDAETCVHIEPNGIFQGICPNYNKSIPCNCTLRIKIAITRKRKSEKGRKAKSMKLKKDLRVDSPTRFQLCIVQCNLKWNLFRYS